MTTASHAGPCTADIDAMQARIDAKLEATAAAGPTARQGTFAGRSDQPTPRSMTAEEVKLGELSPRVVKRVRTAMARARKADGAGEAKACQQALAKVQSAIGKTPQ
jgi:hypothetical protein